MKREAPILDCSKCQNEKRCICNPFKGFMVACPNWLPNPQGGGDDKDSHSS